MSEEIKVLIADDHLMFREGLTRILSRKKGISIVGQASSGDEAIELFEDLLPDLVILYITMPGINGIETSQKILRKYPATKIIIVTASEDEDDMIEALKAGAHGYVLKGASAKDLANAIHIINKGGTYIDSEMANIVLMDLTQSQEPDHMDKLSNREQQITQLVGKGFTNKEIGEQLHLSENTIKHYMSIILQKMHVRSRVEVALLVQKRELKE